METIYPVGNDDDWEVPDEIKQRKGLNCHFGRRSVDRKQIVGHLREKIRRHFVIVVPVEDMAITVRPINI